MVDSVSPAPGLSRAVFGIHGEALRLRQERLQVIASNLANADTPHFQARDLDFNAALRAALANGESAADAGGRMATPPAAPDAHLVYRLATQPSLDGNTVDANVENAAFARAAVEYRATLSFVQGRLATLRTAITGE